MKRYTIDPITRLEGHGKIEIFCNDNGDVENVYFQVPELRGFEKFLEGRVIEEASQIVTKICGVCPGCHHMAAGKATDAVFGVKPTSAAAKIRELFFMAHFIHSHSAHFFALAAPDFVVGPTASPEERNVLGLIAKVGKEAGTEVLKQRRIAQEIQALLAGHQTHCVLVTPGGVRKGITEEERKDLEEKAKGFVEFGQFSLKIFNDLVLENKEYVELIINGPYSLNIYSMGLVDENNKVNFYDGKVRVVDPEGKEHCKYAPEEYTQWVEEHVEPYSYLKYPFLKKIGWKGFVEGKDSGVYHATPLSRLNVADGMATPLAQAEYEKMFETLGDKPVHATLAMHWARLIEMLYCGERALELVQDPEITSTDLQADLPNAPNEGVAIVEAQRGTLTHHYWTDEKGIIQKANIIVGTTNNNAPISMSLKKAAQGLIKNGINVSEGILNMVEMAFRAYDPCFSCATHSLPGQMPIIVNFCNMKGDILRSYKRE